MPLPRAVARFNLRYTNRFIEPLVGRLPGFAVVLHNGRTTGTRYRTPVYVFDHGAAHYIVLTYGPTADWVRNLAAGGGQLERSGRNYTITTHAVVSRDAVWPSLPRIVRLALHILRISEVMQVRTAEHPTAAPDERSGPNTQRTH